MENKIENHSSKNGCLYSYIILMLCLISIGLYIGYIWWPKKYPDASVNYKIIVSVEMDGKLFKGSSVQGLALESGPYLAPGGARVGIKVKGDAVVVDVPGVGAIYALLTKPGNNGRFGLGSEGIYRHLLPESCGLKFGTKTTAEYVLSYEALSGSCFVSDEHLPLFVRFVDASNPASVYRVYPEDLGGIATEEVKLNSVELQITNDPITRNIEEKLEWITSIGNRKLSDYPGGKDNEIAEALYIHGFRR